jgi:hypothetical protein
MQPTTTQCGSGGTLLQHWTGRAGIAERVSPLLGPPAPPTLEGLVTALVNELDAEPSEAEVLLVLDDYHLIDAQTVHASLEFLVDHLPLGLHLVMASRSDRAGWSRPRRPAGPPPAASTSAAWPGCCGRSAARTTRKALGETPRRCRAWPSS